MAPQTGAAAAMAGHRLGDLVARESRRLAELETRDNGKLLREMVGQLAALPDWYYYFAGLARPAWPGPAWSCTIPAGVASAPVGFRSWLSPMI